MSSRRKPGRLFFKAMRFLALGLVIWFGWQPAKHATKHFLASRAAAASRDALQKGDLTEATISLGEALRWDPHDVAVIEAAILYFQAIESEPEALLRQLLQLQAVQPLTPAQQNLLGHTFLRLNKTAEAHKVLENLLDPQAASELQAAILVAEGGRPDPDLGLVLTEDPNAPQARLKIAVTDLSSPMPELVQKSRNELWSLLQLRDPSAMQAASALATTPGLTIAEAQRLLTAVTQHPLCSELNRLQVVSALMQLQPERRTAMIDAEVNAFMGGNRKEQMDFARWLAFEKEHDRLLRLLPRQIIAQSPEYYAVVAESLVHAGQWNQLRDMLENIRPPVSKPLALLWQAEVKSHLKVNVEEIRLLLQSSITGAQDAEDVVTLYKAAEFARRADITDLAETAYKAAAVLSDRRPAELLQHAYEMALVQKNTAELLTVSRKLQELRPASTAFASRVHYYHLLLGVEIEATAAALRRPSAALAAASGAARDVVPLPLLKALVAYRLGPKQDVKVQISKLADASSLPPGMRAVAAGLMAVGGRPADAFQLAEKIHDGLLLPEELSMLRLAR